jgi:hypothetical protein
VRASDRAKALLSRVPWYRAIADERLRRRSPEAIFRDIVAHDKWRGSESISGPGSSLTAASTVIGELPTVMRELRIASMLDLPCGDFHWMRHVDLSGIDYHGADILDELVEANTSAFATPSVRFSRLDILADELPTVDLVLCRDCLVHFSDTDVRTALLRVCDSGSTYLLTTTFTARSSNADIVTGRWRPLNLEIAPFGLPAPISVIAEGSTATDRAFSDKSLGLWLVDDIRAALAASPARDA